MNNLPLGYKQFTTQESSTLFSSSLFKNAAIFTTLLFIFLVPWGDSIYDGLPRLAATLALGLTCVNLIFHGTHRNYNFFHFFTALYFTWQLISLIWSPEFVRGEEVAKTTFQLLLLTFLFCVIIDNKARLIAIYQAYVVGGMIGAGIVFTNFLRGIESGYLRYGIENLTIDAVGVFLSISLPFAAYLSKYSKTKIVRLINLFAIPLIFYGIFLTATRTAFIVGILGLMYWLFTQRKASFKVKSIVGIAMVSAFIAVIMFAPKASIERVFSTTESITQGTLNNRSIIWGGSIEQWKEAPIIGVGLGALGNALSREHVNYNAAHNSFVHILTENGILGLLLFLMVNITLLIYLLHTPINEKAFLFSLLMVMLVSQLATHLQTEKITWFVYAMIAIHSQMYATLKNKN